MNRETVYRPPTRFGIGIHLGSALALITAGALGLWQAAHAHVGPVFLLYLLPGVLAVSVGPILAYQAYALYTCTYLVNREGIRLRWGLRREDIPIHQVLWLRPAQDHQEGVALPWVRLPGLIAGERKQPGLGRVEFMASDARKLLLIGTEARVFAISPADPHAYLLSFQRSAEMGSLSPLEPASIHPSALVSGVWNDRPARNLLLAGLALSIALLVWVSLSVPGRGPIALGFDPFGQPRVMAPPVRLMLLPVLNGLFYIIDLLAGLFSYRRVEHRPLAYLLWGSGALTAFFFIVAAAFILQVS